MPLAKCARCEKLYDKTAAPVCSACLPDEEKDYETVRQYLTENPDSGAEIVSEATGVQISCVLRMIDEGLVLNTITAGQAKCGRCGAPAISLTKKLCNRCLEELNRQLAHQRSQAQIQRRKDVKVGEFSGVRKSLDAKRDQTG